MLIKYKVRAIKGAQSRHCCKKMKSETRQTSSVNPTLCWRCHCPEISNNPGLYLAVIPYYKSDLRPVSSTLSAAALASWRGQAAAGVPPTWAAPPPTGRSSETRRPPMRQSSNRFPDPGTDLRVCLSLIWNRSLLPSSHNLFLNLAVAQKKDYEDIWTACLTQKHFSLQRDAHHKKCT